MNDVTILHALRLVAYWSSPVIFFVGLLLILSAKYKKIEQTLGAEIGGIRKKIIPALEDNNFTFQDWLLRKHTIVGLVCIVCALIFYFVLK